MIHMILLCEPENKQEASRLLESGWTDDAQEGFMTLNIAITGDTRLLAEALQAGYKTGLVVIGAITHDSDSEPPTISDSYHLRLRATEETEDSAG